jgi:hypothetical protein
VLETVCEVREVERCEEVLQEECSLVEEVVPKCREVERQECREVERQECRLKEQECISVEREQCWLAPVGREVSLTKWLHSTVHTAPCS